MKQSIHNEQHQICLKTPQNIQTNQTPTRNVIDTYISNLKDKKSQNSSLQLYDLQEVLTNQKIRWAKKGSMVVSYLEDPSYYVEHADLEDKIKDVNQIEDSQLQTESQDKKVSKRQITLMNNIQKAIKTQQKVQDERSKDKLSNLLCLKSENEKNLLKINKTPKYKLFQTSLQKRNLPPVKLSQFKYLQQFELSKKENPFLNKPLNEIINQSTQDINYKNMNDNSNNNKELNKIRKHVYQQVDIMNKQNQSFNDSTEILNDLNDSLNTSIQYNSQSNIMTERSSYPTITGNVINSSPSRKLPRVFGQKQQSPDRYQSKPPNSQRSYLKNNLHLDDLKIDENEQFYNFNSTSLIHHPYQDYQFSIKSTQITPQRNRKISPHKWKRNTIKCNTSNEQNPYHITINTKNTKNTNVIKQQQQNRNISFQYSKNTRNQSIKLCTQQIIFNPSDDIHQIYTSN